MNMSETIRIYNKSNLKKAQRYDLDNPEENLVGKNNYRHVGIPLTRRSWICMGNCKMCKDDANSTKHRRLNDKEIMKIEIKNAIWYDVDEYLDYFHMNRE